ncbi:MAG TPA: hypothetical protein VHB20_06020 [Verrucomicrobiae bacterium]|jgi:hypothetical protein|nr:hypothetical protein [Verrucomicrobiae bacterium]
MRNANSSAPSPNLARVWLAFILLALAAVVMVSGCRFSLPRFALGNYDSAAMKTQSDGITDEIRRIEIDNRLGAVRVAAVEGPPYGWTWKLETYAQTRAAVQSAISEATLTVSTNDGTLRLALNLPEPARRARYESELELRTPKDVAVQVHNAFGAVEINGVKGPVDARSQSGPVVVQHVRLKVDGQTSFAPLRVEDCGPANLRNQSGAITAGHVHGPLDAETSFGPLRAWDIDGYVTARDTSGSMDATRINGLADVATTFGSIMASDINGPLTAHDQSGSISANHIRGDIKLETSFSSITIDDAAGRADLKNQSGQISVRGVTGDVVANTSFGALDIDGSGDSFICHNQSGPISLRATSERLAKIEARTSFSGINVHLPFAAHPEIHAHTTFGEVASDFPMSPADGGQTARLTLENQSGQIRILRGGR